jgi:SAM-dependent methyltransferase
MNSDASSHWDRKYEEGLPSLEIPDPFFLVAFEEFVAGDFPSGGTALDLGAGLGRHALFLAQRQWNVTTVDISEVAVRALSEKALHLGVSLKTLAIDAKDYPFALNQFDLIIMFYHFDRDIVPSALDALKPGGFILCKSSMIWSRYEGKTPANLQPLGSGEILSMLPGLQVLRHEERPVRDRGVVEYVGQKSSPMSTPPEAPTW